ncbi:MAG: hypothetical protein LBV06_05915 [Propionibacteriaceae bacterium]|nr:hypothetical protein [Propionibacteriaceae bacterium]
MTVEMALAALGVGAALVGCIGGFSAGLAQLRCEDAAAEIARQAARDDRVAVDAIAERLPTDAVVKVESRPSQVHVTVVMDMHAWGEWLPAITLTGEADAQME